MATGVFWQGIPCFEAEGKLTRGAKPDASRVVILAAALAPAPALPFAGVPGFSGSTVSAQDQAAGGAIVPARVPGTLGEPVPQVLGALATFVPGRRVARPRIVDQIPSVGYLQFKETASDGSVDEQVLGPLYVTTMEEEVRSDDGAIAKVILVLVDVRMAYGRGALPRWSFNRVRPDGSVALDSVGKDRKPLTLSQIAAEIVHALPGHPTLTAWPSSWDKDTGPREFPRFAPASLALAHLCQRRGLVDPCLHRDGSIGLYKPGERHKDARDPSPDRLLSEEGRGQVSQLEVSYPPDYALVVGGRTIQTFQTSELEPVLELDGAEDHRPTEDESPGHQNPPLPLRWFVPLEEGLRLLTGGKWDLDFFRRWILFAGEWENVVANGGAPATEGIPDRVIRLLAAQGGRLWRLKGVEKVEQDPVAQVKGVRAKPGPNANLLPIQARAESGANGRRAPAAVESYTWTFRPAAIDGFDPGATTNGGQILAANAVNRARAILAKINDAAVEASGVKGVNLAAPDGEWFSNAHLSTSASANFGFGKFSPDDVRAAATQAQYLDRIGQVSPTLANEYRKALVDVWKAEDAYAGQGGPLQVVGRDIALAEAEKARARWLESGSELTEDEVRDLEEQLAQRKVERSARTITGRPADGKPHGSFYVKNLPLELDEGGGVYSEAHGVFKTSKPSGWIAGRLDEAPAPGRNLDVVAARGGYLELKPPRVTFGATVRPRLDVPHDRTASGSDAIMDPPNDQSTWFVAPFKRAKREAVLLASVDEVPLDQAVSFDRHELVDLVALSGASVNHDANVEAARADVADVMAQPDQVPGVRRKVARPFGVDCDGVVAGVIWRLKPNACGIDTEIITGGDAAPVPRIGATVERPKQRPVPGVPDSAHREGTT